MIMVFSKDTQLNFLENFKADHKFIFLKLLPSGQLKFVVNISITLIVAGNAGNFTKYNFQKVWRPSARSLISSKYGKC